MAYDIYEFVLMIAASVAALAACSVVVSVAWWLNSLLWSLV